MATETFEVSLHGGAPWGFRLQGGKEFRAPLLIAKVTSGSKAAKQGILVGDWLTSINDEPCNGMTHSSALNSIKRAAKDLVLVLERRPIDSSGPYSHSSNSLPRATKLTNGITSNNSEFKSIEGYATLPRSGGSKNRNDASLLDNEDDVDGMEKEEEQQLNSLNTHSSDVSSKYSEDVDEFSSRGDGSLSPSNDEWSPNIISDAVRTPQPIRLVSPDDPSLSLSSSNNAESTRVKSPTSVHGFTDKPAPVGRGARRLNSGSTYTEEEQNGDDSGKHSISPPSSPVFQGDARPAISHLVKRREGVPMALHDTSTDRSWLKYHYVDDERIKRASKQPYRRYSFHGSAMKDAAPKSPESTERPRIQAGSGWYKELFKEMHTGAGNSAGLSSLLAGDASPPKKDARGLFKGYRSRSTEDPVVRATKTQDTQAEPSSAIRVRHSKSRSTSDVDKTNRYSTSSIPSTTATTASSEVVMREKPTTRNNVPSWYKELQQGKDVSEKEMIEDHVRQQKGYQVPGGVRAPGDLGPEYPVVRSYSLGTRPLSGPVVHREPPQKMNTNTHQQRNALPDRQAKPAAMHYPPAATLAPEPNKPSASNLYEDHLRNRQFSPRQERKYEKPQPVDYIKQFEEEEERHKEDEKRAKEDLERKLREESKAREEAEQKQQEIENKKKEAKEARDNPKRARALYNFSPQSAKEINFRKGDIINFYRAIDDNWCEGEAQGKVGLFPSSYMEILEEKVVKAEGEGKVKYNFKAESPRELNLQKGDVVDIIRQIDKNWYEGAKDDKIGIFPVSYIEIIREPVENPQKGLGSPKKVQEEITKQNGLPEVQSSPEVVHSPQRSYEVEKKVVKDTSRADAQDADISKLEGERFIVAFDYAPQNEDELDLLEGDFVKVVEKCDDGWFVGISEKSGHFGTFPGNYVKEIS